MKEKLILCTLCLLFAASLVTVCVVRAAGGL